MNKYTYFFGLYQCQEETARTASLLSIQNYHHREANIPRSKLDNSQQL
jgi:hypothetical protein